jgi:threonine synthase
MAAKRTISGDECASGNFGNICAGILAQSSGLPVGHFIAACNVNDIISEYLETENLRPRKAMATLSNAMDVGNPSNFVRILEIFHHQFPELKQHLSSASITDDETLVTIADVHHKYNYLLDPHGAVGYLALERYLQTHPGQKGIFLETAHPVKFPEAVEKVTGKKIEVPDSIANIMQKEKQSILLKAEYKYLREYLLQ